MHWRLLRDSLKNLFFIYLRMKDPNLKTCKGCPGSCCKYIVIELDTPRSKKDFEEIRWFVTHKNVLVYVEEDGTWNVEFTTPCEFLGKNNLCTIYEKRPEICKKYDHEECTFHNKHIEKHLFRTLGEIDKFIKKRFSKKNENKNKSKN